MNIRLDIAYDGSNYKGWQKQDHAPSIQEEVEKAIKNSLGQKTKLICAGRTDAGVHACGQVANCIIETEIPADKIKYWINNSLPGDIRILASKNVEDRFHARFDAKSKIYTYKIYNKRNMHPLYRNHYQEIYNRLDLETMERASEYFIGSHDFTSFSACLSPDTNTYRTIDSIEIIDKFPVIEINYQAESFLRNQIRIITGTIIQVARGKIKLENLGWIFEARDRSKAGPTLTGSGLYLVKVIY